MNRIFVSVAGMILAGFFYQNEASAADLVKFPTEPAAWTVDIIPSPSAKPASMSSPHLVRIDITQDDQKRRNRQVTSTGATLESWGVPKDNVVFVEDPNGSIIITRGNGPFDVFLIPFTEEAFRWLNISLLVEKDPISYQGKTCFHYRSGKSEAWIESKTLLPVALDDGNQLGTFTFQKGKLPPLTFSPKYQEAYDRFQGNSKPVATH